MCLLQQIRWIQSRLHRAYLLKVDEVILHICMYFSNKAMVNAYLANEAEEYTNPHGEIKYRNKNQVITKNNCTCRRISQPVSSNSNFLSKTKWAEKEPQPTPKRASAEALHRLYKDAKSTFILTFSRLPTEQEKHTGTFFYAAYRAK